MECKTVATNIILNDFQNWYKHNDIKTVVEIGVKHCRPKWMKKRWSKRCNWQLSKMVSQNITIRASLAHRYTLFFDTIFTQGQKEARVLQVLCKS